MLISDKKIEIEKRLKAYDVQSKLNTDRFERQNRLKKLVQKHPVELVALAGGFTEATLKQYIRAAVAPSISENAVTQAETILKGL